MATRTTDAAGLWSLATNWAEDIPPVDGDTAVIAHNTTMDTAFSGAVTINLAKTLTMAATGSLTIAAGKAFTGPGALVAAAGVFTMAATSTIDGMDPPAPTQTGGIVTLNTDTDSFIWTLTGGTFVVGAGATFAVGTAMTQILNGGNIVVNGTMDLASGGAFTFTAGTMLVNGALKIDTANISRTTIAAGKILRVAGGLHLDSVSVGLPGAGSVILVRREAKIYLYDGTAKIQTDQAYGYGGLRIGQGV